MYHWRWSNGETYYKSAREITKESEDLQQELVYDSRQNAINQSLADNINTSSEMDMIDITNSMFSRSQNETNNRREHLDDKLANRQMMFQRGVNPFLNQTSYVNDVVVRDMFLKPACTTHEKIKEENKIDN
jgi:hypothetical protein